MRDLQYIPTEVEYIPGLLAKVRISSKVKMQVARAAGESQFLWMHFHPDQPTNQPKILSCCSTLLRTTLGCTLVFCISLPTWVAHLRANTNTNVNTNTNSNKNTNPPLDASCFASYLGYCLHTCSCSETPKPRRHG